MIGSNITIRSGELADIPLIFSFIQKKAAFDRHLGAFSGRLQTTETALRETLFNEFPFAKVLFAEDPQQPIGFALYYFRYSSFRGRPSLWLDDLYVDETKRGQGIGTVLLQQLVTIAQTHQCSHLAWTADVANERGIRFYEKVGATVIEQQSRSLTFQLDVAEFAIPSKIYLPLRSIYVQ
jgi:GNAT superfamily N-acetyltransferase